MDTVILVSDNQKVILAFAAIKRSRSLKFRLFSHADWPQNPHRGLVYLDLSEIDREEAARKIAELSELSLPWGLVDPRSLIEDPAEVFHLGGADYMSFQDGEQVSVKRLRRVLDFAEKLGAFESPQSIGGELNVEKKRTHSADLAQSWDGVKNRGTYTFCFFFIELIPSSDWQGRASDSHQEKMRDAFHDLVEAKVKEYDGRIWMWNEWGGVVLFPFDGESCPAVELGMRMLLNRVILSLEGGPFHGILEYRMAFHIGSSQYKTRGQTGDIISDDVNFIFHLGKKKAAPGALYLSDSVYEILNPRQRSLFEEDGSFEGHASFKMSSPFIV